MTIFSTTILKELGLSPKEIEVYLALVKMRYLSASEAAREVNLPRQTVYSILDKLRADGFIEVSDKKGVKQFIADPEKLLLLLDRQRQDLEIRRLELEKELPQLMSLQKRHSGLPRVQYYDGREGLKRLFNNILDQYKKGDGKFFRGYGINKFHEALGEFLYDFVKKRNSYGVQTKLFIGQGPDDFGITTEVNKYGREVKHLPMEPQQAGMYLVGNKLYLFSYEDNVGVVIDNPAIVRLLQNVFDDHWKRTQA